MPPVPHGDQDYAANAFVPPWTVQTGLASFVLRVAEGGSLVSAAEGGWLVHQPGDRFRVSVGTVVVITEGPRVVGYFHVDEVAAHR
jgi:hypothetical protein